MKITLEEIVLTMDPVKVTEAVSNDDEPLYIVEIDEIPGITIVYPNYEHQWSETKYLVRDPEDYEIWIYDVDEFIDFYVNDYVDAMEEYVEFLQNNRNQLKKEYSSLLFIS